MKTRSVPANSRSRESRGTPATVLVSKPEKRATPWSSWTMMSPVRRSENERSAPRRRGPPPSRSRPARGAPRPFVVALGAPAAEEPVLGDDRELEAGCDEALAQARDGEAQ